MSNCYLGICYGIAFEQTLKHSARHMDHVEDNLSHSPHVVY